MREFTSVHKRTMDSPSAAMRDLARRLLVMEAAHRSDSLAQVHEAVRVCEKLQTSLTRFAGAEGFASLLRRALALARAEVPALQTIELKADGSLEGLKELASGNGPTEAAIAITAHLLGLLETFIGRPNALRLVRQAWPDVSWNE